MQYRSNPNVQCDRNHGRDRHRSSDARKRQGRVQIRLEPAREVRRSRRARGWITTSSSRSAVMKGEPEWMRKLRHEALDIFFVQADPDLGRRSERDRLSGHLLLHQARRSRRARAGTTCRPTSRRPSTSWASPRPSASSWPAWARSMSARPSTTRCKQEWEKQGVIFVDSDSGLREHEDIYREYFGTVIPSTDNIFAALNTAVLVGRLVRLCAEGRASGHPAAGVLPHQRPEHGPVRAHADHRGRRRQRPLRRRLHGADLLPGLAAQRRDRDHRPQGRALPLHDHPELVDQRLQPGDAALAGATRARRWSGWTATWAPRSR